MLVNVSNDAWFGDTLAPHQHLEITRMRAIETGRYLLRATNTGITAVVDPVGKVIARSPQFQRTTLTAMVQPRTGLRPTLGGVTHLRSFWLLLCSHSVSRPDDGSAWHVIEDWGYELAVFWSSFLAATLLPGGSEVVVALASAESKKPGDLDTALSYGREYAWRHDFVFDWTCSTQSRRKISSGAGESPTLRGACSVAVVGTVGR